MLSGCFGGQPDAPQEAGEDSIDSVPTDLQEFRATVRDVTAAGQPIALWAAPVFHAGGVPGSSGHREEPVEIEVQLKPSTVWTNATWTEVDGEREPAPDLDAYEGHVVDRPDWPVRLVVTDDWARGYVLGTEPSDSDGREMPRSFHIRMNMDGNLPPGVRDAVAPATFNAPRNTTAPENCRVLPDGYRWSGEMHLTPITERPPAVERITVRLVLDAEGAFLEAYREDAFPAMVAMIHEADAIYEREVGLRLELVGLHAHTERLPFAVDANGYSVGQLDAVRTYWNERSDVERDLVHLYSAEEGAPGVAYCIGSAGAMTEDAYSMTPALREERTYIDRHAINQAHEIAHAFNAFHQYANSVETGRPGQGSAMDGNHRPAFSTLSKAVIRGWADEYLGDGAMVSVPPADVEILLREGIV